MNELLRIVGITKQAMHRHFKQEELFGSRVATLVAEADALRKSHPGCGVETMYYVLNPSWLGRDRFIELMMGLGYRVKSQRNFIRTTRAGIFHYQNLIEGMILWNKNQLWQSDITYFRIRDKFYYIVFIIDVYTKRILGYQVSDHLRAEANLAALKMALRTAGPEVAGLIHHSDRGSQYGDKEYTGLLLSKGISISMGIKPQENAYAESLNGIMKNEYLNRWLITSFMDLKRYVARAVRHYNNFRIHGSLPQKISPIEFEKNLLFLQGQKRPTVIVYAEGKSKIAGGSNPSDLLPEKTLRAPVCPIVN